MFIKIIAAVAEIGLCVYFCSKIQQTLKCAFLEPLTGLNSDRLKQYCRCRAACQSALYCGVLLLIFTMYFLAGTAIDPILTIAALILIAAGPIALLLCNRRFLGRFLLKQKGSQS